MNEIKKAAVFSYIAIAITILTTIIYTPVLVKGLGNNEYALYSIVMSFASYLAILDLGLGNAVIRYVSTNLIKQKEDELKNLIGMFIKMFSILSLVTIIIGTVIVLNSELLFGDNFSNEELNRFKLMMCILTFSAALSLPLSVFGSVTQAYERLVIFKFINLLRITFIPLISIPFVYLGFTSITLIIVFVFINLSTLLYFYFYCTFKLNVKYDFVPIDKNILREIIYYSIFIFINVLVDQLYWNTGQIILGSNSSAFEVTIYSIAVQFVKMYMMIATVIGALFLPSLSKKNHLPNFKKESSLLIQKIGKYLLYILFYVYIGFYFFGEYFIKLWLGKDYTSLFNIVLVLFTCLIIPLSQNVGISVLQALNKHAFRAIVLFFISIINFVVCLIISPKYGAFGVATSTGISLLIGNVFAMNVYYHFFVKISMIGYWKNTISMFLKISILIIFCEMLSLGRVENLMEFIIDIVLFSGIFLLFVYFTLNIKVKRINELFHMLLLRVKVRNKPD